MDGLQADEAALWERSLQRDSRAFTALFDAHRDAVYRQAYRVTGDHAEAEEVSAIAFLELWRLRERVRIVNGSVLPWLLVTTLNTARNSSRAARRHRGMLARLPAPTAPQDATDETLDELHRSERIRAALSRLAHRDQQLAALVLVADIPVPAAAAALDMQERTARNRLSLIRRRLRADLEDLSPATSTS